MFIFNINLNKTKLTKIFIIILTITLIIFGIYFLTKNHKTRFVNNSPQTIETIELTENNYTNFLKQSHDNLSDYIGKKIRFTGFVYRLYDFKQNQFVLGREMIISEKPENKAEVIVVGFLCDCKNGSDFENNTWVEVEGTIKKGFYHSEIPIIEVSKINKTNKPENQYVYPPNINM